MGVQIDRITTNVTVEASKYTPIDTRCPDCGQQSECVPVDSQIPDLHVRNDWEDSPTILGQRLCPNSRCGAHIFFIYCYGDYSLETFPPARVGFDSTDIPEPIAGALEEAITCHANKCYTAAAIMVRKTLEELCADCSVTGGSLKDRLANLRSAMVLSTELLDGLEDLRLLGNDAAHIESQAYNEVGREEVEIAIDITKEVLKALYQHAHLIERLRERKKQRP